MESIISESLLFVVVFTLIFRYLQSFWNKEKTHQLSGASVLPFISHAFILIKYYFDMIIFIVINIVKENPNWFGPAVGIFIKDPHDAETVLAGQKAVAKDISLYKVVIPFVGQGLLASELSLWRKDRKLISPSFSQKNTLGYYEIFQTNAHKLAEELRKEEGKGLFNVYHYISSINLKTICETSIGMHDNPENTEKHLQLIHAVDRGIHLCTQRLSKIWYFVDFTYKFSSLKNQNDVTAANYQRTLGSIIDSAKREYYTPKEQSNTETKRSKYLLEDLLNLNHHGERFTNQQLQDHISTVVIAGYETSASTLGFALTLLGTYPDVQEKVYQEIVDVVGVSGRIEYEQLKNLQYMEMVVKEVLRFYPVAPYLARIAEEEIKLSNQTVPAGSPVIVSIFDLQRNPNSWPDPMKFDPDRFLPEETSKRHPYSWIPFSAGPRNCLGIRYAWMTMKLMLTCVMREYYIETIYKDVQDIPIKVGIVVKPIDGHLIRIKNRKHLVSN